MGVSVRIKCTRIKEKNAIKYAASTYYFSFGLLALLKLLLNKCAAFLFKDIYFRRSRNSVLFNWKKKKFNFNEFGILNEQPTYALIK
jgi:hypothetical protein